MKVTVLGALGGTGQQVVQQLLEADMTCRGFSPGATTLALQAVSKSGRSPATTQHRTAIRVAAAVICAVGCDQKMPTRCPSGSGPCWSHGGVARSTPRRAQLHPPRPHTRRRLGGAGDPPHPEHPADRLRGHPLDEGHADATATRHHPVTMALTNKPTTGNSPPWTQTPTDPVVSRNWPPH